MKTTTDMNYRRMTVEEAVKHHVTRCLPDGQLEATSQAQSRNTEILGQLIQMLADKGLLGEKDIELVIRGYCFDD